jgi:hypothetical protein
MKKTSTLFLLSLLIFGTTQLHAADTGLEKFMYDQSRCNLSVRCRP